jgi:hypothetical protein
MNVFRTIEYPGLLSKGTCTWGVSILECSFCFVERRESRQNAAPSLALPKQMRINQKRQNIHDNKTGQRFSTMFISTPTSAQKLAGAADILLFSEQAALAG